MNFSSNHKNITPRRSKALPVVEHPTLGKCILISKEASHGRWSLFGGGNNNKKDSRGNIISQEKSSDAVVRELQEELGKGIVVKKIEDLGTIITNKTGRLISQGNSSIIKQRIFALLAEGETKKDDKEIESVGYYPLEEKYSDIRNKLRENMDDFAKKALIDYRKKLLSSSYEVGDIIVPRNDRGEFDMFLGKLGHSAGYTRSLISRILGL